MLESTSEGEIKCRVGEGRSVVRRVVRVVRVVLVDVEDSEDSESESLGLNQAIWGAFFCIVLEEGFDGIRCLSIYVGCVMLFYG